MYKCVVTLALFLWACGGEPEGVPEAPAAAAAPAAAEAPAPAKAKADVAASGAEWVTLKHEEIDSAMEIESLTKLGRALLHRNADGELDGYRLSGLRSGTLPTKFGFRDGDVIHRLNDMDLHSVAAAAEAWTTYQDASEFRFQISRDGKPHSLNIRIE